MRNSTKNAPIDVQMVTSHNGIGLGYNPGRINKNAVIEVTKTKLNSPKINIENYSAITANKIKNDYVFRMSVTD